MARRSTATLSETSNGFVDLTVYNSFAILSVQADINKCTLMLSDPSEARKIATGLIEWANEEEARRTRPPDHPISNPS